jgi:hypothetical protein
MSQMNSRPFDRVRGQVSRLFQSKKFLAGGTWFGEARGISPPGPVLDSARLA